MNDLVIFNPRISIGDFPIMERPTLFCWQEAARSAICDDGVPGDLETWMRWRDQRTRANNIIEFGISKDGEIGGHFEAKQIGAGETDDGLDDSLSFFGECRLIFKKDFREWFIIRTGLNLCLQDIFDGKVESAFFPVFSHNHRLKELLFAVGCNYLGLIAPRLQQGIEKPCEMLAITSREWEKQNRKFLAAQAEFAKSSEVVGVGMG